MLQKPLYQSDLSAVKFIHNIQLDLDFFGFTPENYPLET